MADEVADDYYQFKPVAESEYRQAMNQAPSRLMIVDFYGKGEIFKDNTLTVQYNPEEFDEDVKVEWAKAQIPGLSHRPLHYMGTNNAELAFSLAFDALVDGSTIKRILDARRFLKSMCYPRRGATSVRDGQAPRLLFLWPNFLSLTAVIADLSFKYERFAADGHPLRYTVKVKLEAVRDARLHGDDLPKGT